MTVAGLDQQLTSSELTEWMAYEQIVGPLGVRRADIQAATVAATVANASRGKGRKYNVKDFLINYGKGNRPQTGLEMLARIKSINATLGGVEHGGCDG